MKKIRDNFGKSQFPKIELENRQILPDALEPPDFNQIFRFLRQFLPTSFNIPDLDNILRYLQIKFYRIELKD